MKYNLYVSLEVSPLLIIKVKGFRKLFRIVYDFECVLGANHLNMMALLYR
jgi:hypothetical protein